MTRILSFSVWVLGLAAWTVLAFAGSAQAEGGLKGWENDSEYNKLYKSSELDSFKGSVESIEEIVPMPGMAPGVGLRIKDQDGDMVKVHLGPKSFVKTDSVGLAKGDRVKVRGCWAELNGEDVFLASKVKKSEFVELKVRRTRDGAPFWNMTPEELAAEKADE